ncbi:MAG TPA: tRNA (adenosine(37)-N6)-threonylcarbamoyltransferase complex dimerization subunit type 1 TsaB [Erysipelotrichaceae bacterium]|nr:tRNA (adenosine(37)-N6)-threonylcarbamoyltransferase complex dimerization subunit type 1 TsaB [Erysipelotrichia bacterium]HPX32102.1 tRNA (adenosine(37)-N6)-threonylcarbamoyltransferase complex dimerization subunit type 1 TsaB [Erysipelotrichaceae bacterium]HQA84565.1 tRNA (adenosine(37)-N6)-threonylcarbamoyltransferase complex dimerization subunit type 1 TsaB [Erysipelotrichaceae bacterium]
MYTIGIDTSHHFLLLVLMDENKVVDYIQDECPKLQSEYIIVELDNLLKRNDISLTTVKDIVVTIGPGSYTGVRIGLTVAKILGSIVGKTVYTLSTLQLYAGVDNALVLMDARANRCYVGRYSSGTALVEDTVLTNDEIRKLLNENITLIGDLHLFDKKSYYPNLAQNFFLLKQKWQKVDNIDILTPVYLKSSQEYLRK